MIDVACRYRVSDTSLARHMAAHGRADAPEAGRPSPPPAAAATPSATAGGVGTVRTTLEQARAHLAEIDELLAKAKISGEPLDKLLAERGRALGVLGKLTGELGASESTLAASPYWKRLRAALVEVLRQHPDAARAVLEVIERAEGVPS